jgi:mRNA interferase MazF
VGIHKLKGGFKMIDKNKLNLKRGDVILVDLGSRKGSVQSGIRPVIIVGNDMSNTYSTAITVIPTTSKMSKKSMPTHVLLNSKNSGIEVDSIAMAEQITTIDKSQIINTEPFFTLSNMMMYKIGFALIIQLALAIVTKQNGLISA